MSFTTSPFSFNVTAISPLIYLSPVTPSDANLNLRWAPSCTIPDCLPTASWSTSAINSTLSFQYWGRGVALGGRVEGNMSIQFLRNGIQAAENPSGDILTSWPDDVNELDYIYPQNITLKVVDASPNSKLTITRVRVNSSSITIRDHPGYRWTVPSNTDGLKYTGFIQQTGEEQTEYSTTYIPTVGGTVSMRFNGSSLLVYGPCGPENGLMRITLDDQQKTVNTSKPFASSDCLLFQTWGLLPQHFHRLLIENVDGKMLGINRFELFRVITGDYRHPDTVDRGMAVGFGVASMFVTSTMIMTVYVIKFVKRRRAMGEPRANRHWFQLLFS